MFRVLISFLFMVVFANAGMFQSVPPKSATILQEGDAKLYCHKCGMTLPMFYKTNHSAKVDNKEVRQYCSIHCLATDHNHHNLSNMQVVDTKNLNFIDVRKAFYVVNSSKRGTMSMVSKYAFSTESDAKEFQSKNGGTIMRFDEALQEAKNGLPKDHAMIHKKREKAFKVGNKIYNNFCDKSIALDKFESIAQAKAFVVQKSLCQNINGKKLQALAIYLANKDKAQSKAIAVPKDAKCPVCGMFVAKYPKWVAKITTKDSKKFYFDGVKDMMKFIYSNKNLDTKNIEVTNYYTTKGIEAKTAFYVVGSNVYGPMGEELIPFSSEFEANSFKKEHLGKKIYEFDEITKELVESL
jgi:nitrous oxide reductase accessory protein NosL